MLLKRKMKADVVTTVGLVLLIVANLGNYFLHRANQFSETVADGGSGFLFGLAIGTLLLGIAMKARDLERKRIDRE
jgi:hypothetical protein